MVNKQFNVKGTFVSFFFSVKGGNDGQAFLREKCISRLSYSMYG